MCTADEGRELRRVFNRYKDGVEITEESDKNALISLSRTTYVEFYVENGKICARAGRAGRMIKSVPQ